MQINWLLASTSNVGESISKKNLITCLKLYEQIMNFARSSQSLKSKVSAIRLLKYKNSKIKSLGQLAK